MKKSLLTAGILVGLGSTAFAADLPRAVAPVVVAPALFSWTGIYFGGNVGYGFDVRDRDEDRFGFNRSVTIPGGAPGFFAVSPTNTIVPGFAGTPVSTAPSTISPFGNSVCNGSFGCTRNDRDGFVGGVQSGFNYQFTPGAGLVIGYESDIQFADFDRRRNDNFGFGAFGIGNTVPVGTVIGPGVTAVPAIGSTANTITFFDPLNNRERRSIDYFGTIRARVGYALDRTLVYATGGFAYGGSRQHENDIPIGVGTVQASFASSGGCGFRDDCNRMRYGFAVGGGVEYAFTENLSAKLEGLYVNLRDNDNGRDAFTNFGGGNTPFARDSAGFTYFAPVTAFTPGFTDRRRDDSFVVGRVGVNYRFNVGLPAFLR